MRNVWEIKNVDLGQSPGPFDSIWIIKNRIDCFSMFLFLHDCETHKICLSASHLKENLSAQKKMPRKSFRKAKKVILLSKTLQQYTSKNNWLKTECKPNVGGPMNFSNSNVQQKGNPRETNSNKSHK